MHQHLIAALLASTIAPGVHLIPGAFVPGTQPDGNSVVFRARSGLIVVDTGRHAEHTQSIIDFAKSEKKTIAAIINTHWHLDHIGGNALLRREYPAVTVFATSALSEARRSFLANYRKQLAEMIERAPDAETQKSFKTEMALIDAGAQLEPDVIVSRPGRQSIAGRKLSLGVETRAVTAGDIWIYDPKTRVLVSGDLVTLPAPFLDTACPARWKESLARLSEVNFEVLIPGHGAPMTRSDFERYRGAYGNLLDCSASKRTKDDCINGWLNDTASLIPEKDRKFTRALMDYYVDLLRRDQGFTPDCK